MSIIDPAAHTLRKQPKTKPNQDGGSTADRATLFKPIVKPVLANPLTVPWPNLPLHLQKASLHALQVLIPDEIPAYHTARDRCHRSEKRTYRSKRDREAVRQARAALPAKSLGGSEIAVNAAVGPEETGAGAGESSKRALSPAPAGEAGPSKKRKTDPSIAGQGQATSAAEEVQPPVMSETDPTVKPRPEPPASLAHLVFGINEVVRALEKQTDELRMRIMLLGDAMKEGQGRSGKGRGRRGKGEDGGDAQGADTETGTAPQLLPTAPAPDSDSDSDPEDGAEDQAVTASATTAHQDGTREVDTTSTPTSSKPHSLAPTAPASAIEYIVLPLGSINPPSLVAHIPPYVATHNTLVYQFRHLARTARARMPAARAEAAIAGSGTGTGGVAVSAAGAGQGLGKEKQAGNGDVGTVEGKGDGVEEVRVVPLGKVEDEISRMAGLRRVACVGVRRSHPALHTLRALLPASILIPPRFSLTLPFPIPSLALAVHTGDAAALQLLPHVHYAPVHVKGLTTTIPADGNARKAKRMEAVRRRRLEVKERKRLGLGLGKGGGQGEGRGKGEGKGKGKGEGEGAKKGDGEGKSEMKEKVGGGGSGTGGTEVGIGKTGLGQGVVDGDAARGGRGEVAPIRVPVPVRHKQQDKAKVLPTRRVEGEKAGASAGVAVAVKTKTKTKTKTKVAPGVSAGMRMSRHM